jgi:dihydrofolate reductase
MKPPHISILCAMTPNGVIGKAGTMPWHLGLKSDLRRFREMTTPGVLMMGPRTQASIGRALPGRLNVVLTSNRSYKAPPGVEVAHDLSQALKIAEISGYTELYAIGGAMVYRSFLPLAQHLFITYVWSEAEGDTHFPYFDQSQWQQVTPQNAKWRLCAGDQYPTRFVEYRRIMR